MIGFRGFGFSTKIVCIASRASDPGRHRSRDGATIIVIVLLNIGCEIKSTMFDLLSEADILHVVRMIL